MTTFTVDTQTFDTALLVEHFALTDRDGDGCPEWIIKTDAGTARVFFAAGENQIPGWTVVVRAITGNETVHGLPTQDTALVIAADSIDFDFAVL